VIRQNTLAKDHPDVAEVMLTPATSYRGQGKHAEALRLLNDAMPIFEKAEGKDGSDVADCLVEQAAIDRDRGTLADEEAKLKRALVIRERRGKDHPQVARCHESLAQLYQAQRRHAEAEAEYRHALYIWAKACLQDHPQVAKLLDHYAEMLRRRGLSHEAKEMESRAQSIRSKHPVNPPLK